jgi:hypothetical protein
MEDKKMNIEEKIHILHDWINNMDGCGLDELIQEYIIDGKRNKEMKLRELLWLNHGCEHPALYGDDGEMQCNTCMIDFKRDSEDEIEKKIVAIRLKIMAEFIASAQEDLSE